MLKSLGVKCLDVCFLLSNGSKEKMYIQMIDGNKAKFQDVNDYSVQVVGIQVFISLLFQLFHVFENVHNFLERFIHLFLSVPGLHFCMWAFPSCGYGGLLFVAAHGLIVVASVLAEHRLQVRGLQELQLKALHHAGPVAEAKRPSCFVACGDLSGTEFKLVSPALAGGFLNTRPPGKPS